MTRYTDELQPLLTLEQELRRQIALCIAEESGQQVGASLSEDQMSAADEAMAAWTEQGEEDQDLRAFRPIGPLQKLLIEHRRILERIIDIRDRRLS